MLYFTLGTIAYPFYYIFMILLAVIGIVVSYVLRFFRNMNSFAVMSAKYKLFPWQFRKLTEASLLELQNSLKEMSKNNDSKE